MWALRRYFSSSAELFIDGSCLGNNSKQQSGRRAGIGVWFGDGHAANVSEPYAGPPPATNNRAELWALIRVLQLAIDADQQLPHHLVVKSDSQYVVDYAPELWRRLQSASRAKDLRRPANADLWRTVRLLMRKVQRRNIVVEFVHVGREQNAGADRLARSAAGTVLSPKKSRQMNSSQMDSSTSSLIQMDSSISSTSQMDSSQIDSRIQMDSSDATIVDERRLIEPAEDGTSTKESPGENTFIH